MFRLITNDKVVGTTKFESGDPEAFSVSGVLKEAGDPKDVAAWILECGGVEEEGAYLLEIGEKFLVVLGEHTPIPFNGGSLIAVPDESEIFLEITNIPEPEYNHFFAAHIAEFARAGNDEEASD